MTMEQREGSFLFLGTGSSSGIPVIGCTCKVCTSDNPKNKRLRSSALVQFGEKNYLIDAGPDIRAQALQYHINKLDGLILTHTHFDHIGGLEELRIYNFKQQHALPCLLSSESLLDIKQLFYYLFAEKAEGQNYTSQYDFITHAEKQGKLDFHGLPVRFMNYYQGGMKVMGLRFGDLAYLTDIKTYSEDLFEFLKGVNTLIVSALRFTPSQLHLSIDEAIDFAMRVGAKESYFMHLSHDIEHAHVSSLLPKGIYLAYDGLKLKFTADKI
jgi:phosphoribosyl 1,2-cyclic phosphate phosphodiesterase